MTAPVVDHAAHSPYSDPGRFADLLDAVAPDIPAVAEASRNIVVHYRASGTELPPESVVDIHSRWLERILEVDQSRHPLPLLTPRDARSRVQGCCRDHTLLAVGALRQHGVPARSRVGFAGYFVPGWNHDHVVAEVWDGGRWVRFDPEFAGPTELLPTPHDIPAGSGFATAAEVWTDYRAGRLDPMRYGVDVSMPDECGPWFIRNYVILEVAHRFGDELLLWDNWGTMQGPDDDLVDLPLIDRVAGLLLAADAGDADAERELLALYRSDDRLHPGDTVFRVDLPHGGLVADSLIRSSGFKGS